ncbi:MAG: hypothetical protein JST53_02490 [Actinobacteria bacterium]|nr:hypothetical protein [Actinomycetota bacterium]
MADESPEMRPAGAPSPAVERAAAAEVNGRRVNEAIERGARGTGTAIFVCECGNLGCNETVEMAISEYEAVRSGFERFLIVPGHEIGKIEDVVEQHDSYLVVAKRDDEAVKMAYATDERDDG